MPKKTAVAETKVKPVTQAELDKELSGLTANNIKKQAEKELTAGQLNVLKRIAYYVGKVGLDLHESCILLGLDPDKFREEMKIHPIIGTIITMKEIEFKKDMLATLSARGRGGDDKIAQWLLEKKDPDNYGKQKKGNDGATDPMAAVLEFVQTTEQPAHGLVKKTSGRAVLVKGKQKKMMSTEELLNKIHTVAKTPAAIA